MVLGRYEEALIAAERAIESLEGLGFAVLVPPELLAMNFLLARAVDNT
jgi:hypothetical protein